MPWASATPYILAYHVDGHVKSDKIKLATRHRGGLGLGIC